MFHRSAPYSSRRGISDMMYVLYVVQNLLDKLAIDLGEELVHLS